MNTTRTSARTRRIARLCTVGLATAAVAITSGTAVEASPNRIVQQGESIQAAIDAAPPGTEIRIRGDHTESVWIYKDGITLKGLDGASITLPEEAPPSPCQFPVVVCAIPEAAIDAFPDFPRPFEFLRDVGVQDLTLNAPNGDGAAGIFVRGFDVIDNEMPVNACNAVFAFSAEDVRISGNQVGSSDFCDGIAVLASERVRVLGNTSNNSLFAGISINDTSTVRVQNNSMTGNCIGIVAFDSDGPLPASDITIARNTANGNNDVCFPFGPEIPVGVTGILGVAVDGLTIKNNTANDNVSEEFTITAGGIVVQDDVQTGLTVQDLLVSRNTATGNSSAAGPVDLAIATASPMQTVKKNNCDVSVPEPAWCGG